MYCHSFMGMVVAAACLQHVHLCHQNGHMLILLTCYAQGKTIEDYRNSFVTLALPLFASSEPLPMKTTKFKELSWSLWDRWILEGDLVVQVRPCGSLPFTIYT